MVALDTRNAFEVDHCSFEGAIDWRLHKFSDFPAALEAHRTELEGKTVVSFCTGGIRCEKAAIYIRAVASCSTNAGCSIRNSSRGPRCRRSETPRQPNQCSPSTGRTS